MMVVACKVAEVPPGEGKRIELPGRAPIAVFNVGGRFYAIDDTCTHGEASLCEGFADGTVVECPFHAGTFDLVTGKALTFPATEPVRAYAARVEGEDVVLEFD
jgi:nitrite reductase/ring-hydroxylating ferredoxin subunit